MSSDLTIETALADPMIRAAMRADRVNPGDFEALLRSTATRLGDTPARRSVAPLALVAARPSPRNWNFCCA